MLSNEPLQPSTDLSYLTQTTSVQVSGLTNEYHFATRTGTIPIADATKPLPENSGDPQLWEKDPEKAKQLKDAELVTWLENDPENSRNWSKAYRWCRCLR